MPSPLLYRLAAGIGFLSAAIITISAARRGGVVPENDLTHTIAPFGVLAGLFALTGLYLWQRAEAGRLGLVGYGLNAIGLAGAVGIEYTLHFVFPSLDNDVVTALVDGRTGTAFRVTAVILLCGVLTFAAASLRARRLPAGAVALYALGMIPGSLRTVVPVPVYVTGLVVAAAGIAWLSLALYRGASREPGTPVRPARAAVA